MGLPNIEITFKGMAGNVISRSQRGVICIVIHDDTNKEKDIRTYTDLVSIQKDIALYEENNYKAILSAFLGMPSKIYVVRIDKAAQFNTATSEIDSLRYDWICYLSSTGQEAVVSYVTNKNNVNKAYKVRLVTFKQKADNKYIVNFTNDDVSDTSNNVIPGYMYLSRLAGLLAGMPLDRTATYYPLTDLKSVSEPTEVDKAIDNGEFIIINDFGEVKVARGVTSLTTTSTTDTSDMKSIAVVEAMCIINADIYTNFKNNYIGKQKNKQENQILLISAIGSYLKTLTEVDVLDGNYDNNVSVNIDKQRDAWVSNGVIEAATWSNEDVKKRTFKNKVFLSGKIKILDAIEDISLEFELE